MMRPDGGAGLTVYICVEPVDFRKRCDALSVLVQEALALNPFDEQLFVFTNKRRDQCRVLYWERSGFVLWSKKLQKQRFPWPRRGDADSATLTLSAHDLNLLLDGYDIWRMQPHQRLFFESVA